MGNEETVFAGYALRFRTPENAAWRYWTFNGYSGHDDNSRGLLIWANEETARNKGASLEFKCEYEILAVSHNFKIIENGRK